MAQRLVIFDANSLLKLLTHYGDGAIPLDSELKSAGVSAFMERWIGLDVASDKWESDRPLHVRYEGRKVLVWSNDGEGAPPVWSEDVEGPKLQ